jgi:hypothetical protein
MSLRFISDPFPKSWMQLGQRKNVGELMQSNKVARRTNQEGIIASQRKSLIERLSLLIREL